MPGWGNAYAMYVYPSIARTLSSFSRLIPFAIGDLFIALSIAGVLLYPAYARCIRKRKWSRILLKDVKYLLWVYVWFYLAWGLNYSQKNFYERTRIPYTAYTPENFRSFTDGYIENLNSSYTGITSIDKELVCRESVQAYNQIGDSLGVHRPFHQSPRVKTMLFTPLISMVGVTGSMAPFFCEFTLNGDLLPLNIPPLTPTSSTTYWASPARRKPISTPIRYVPARRRKTSVSAAICPYCRTSWAMRAGLWTKKNTHNSTGASVRKSSDWPRRTANTG